MHLSRYLCGAWLGLIRDERRGEEEQGPHPAMVEKSRYHIWSKDGEEEEHGFVVQVERRERNSKDLLELEDKAPAPW
jgi:hypothetical protein